VPRAPPKLVYVTEDPWDKVEDAVSMVKEAVVQAAMDAQMWLSEVPDKLKDLKEGSVEAKWNARMWFAEVGGKTGVTPAAQRLMYNAGKFAQDASEHLEPIVMEVQYQFTHHSYAARAALSAAAAGLVAWARTHPTQVAGAAAKLAPALSAIPGLQLLGTLMAVVSMYITVNTMQDNLANPAVPLPGAPETAPQESASTGIAKSQIILYIELGMAVGAASVALAVWMLRRRASSASATVAAQPPAAMERPLGSGSPPLFSGQGQMDRMDAQDLVRGSKQVFRRRGQDVTVVETSFVAESKA